ncbi:MAG: hypothetical protein LBQ15_01320 [Clostridium sp.]|jgi:hypothetical protein|nr:hypothetical protein [Clostridium sp.]
MKKWIVFGVAVVILFVGVMIVVLHLFLPSSTPVTEVAFQEISFLREDQKVILNGELLSSGKSYRGYRYRMVNDVLIVTIQSELVNPGHPNGAFHIEIMEEQPSNVRNIAIESGNDITPIYPR